MIFLGATGLVNFVTSILLTAVVLIQPQKNAKKVAFISLSLSIALYSAGYFLWQMAGDPATARAWFRLLFQGIALINFTYLVFVYTIREELVRRRLDIILHVAALLIFSILSWTDLLYGSFSPRFGMGYWPIPKPAFSVFLVVWFYQCFYGFFLLLQSLNQVAGVRREQVKYFLIAAVFGFGGGATNWPMWFGINFPPYFNIFISFYVAIVSYAIIRYRLMDIRVAITSAGVFLAVYALTLGAPFYLYMLGHHLAAFLLVSILATTAPFTYIYFQQRAKNRLLAEQHAYQETLRQASAGMGRIRDLKKLLNLIVSILTRAVRMEHAFIYILERSIGRYRLEAARRGSVSGAAGKQELPEPSLIVETFRQTSTPLIFEEIRSRGTDSHDAGLKALADELNEIAGALVFPIYTRSELIAVVVMGKKDRGRPYSEDDLAVFSILANQAALAIENARFYEDMQRTQAQLFQAEKMATVGTMADGLSHQINNRFHALGFIAGDALDTIKIMKQKGLAPETAELLAELEHSFRRVEENVAQGGEIVRGLLRYTRKGEEGFAPVDLKTVFKAAFEMTQFKIKANDLSVTYDLPENLPAIKGNFTQLQEVFFNMIDNAYDAMKQRQQDLQEEGYHPVLTLSACAEDQRVVVTLTDNGIGVSEADQRKVFTPFFTTKLSSKKGTGLGLYVIKKIIEENHHGEVEFHSEQGKGTRFTLRLPIAVPSG